MFFNSFCFWPWAWRGPLQTTVAFGAKFTRVKGNPPLYTPQLNYNITQYGELGFSQLTQMKDNPSTHSHCITYTFLFKNWENILFELGSERVNKFPRILWYLQQISIFLGLKVQHGTLMCLLPRARDGTESWRNMGKAARVSLSAAFWNSSRECCVGWAPSDATDHRPTGTGAHLWHPGMGCGKYEINAHSNISKYCRLIRLLALWLCEQCSLIGNGHSHTYQDFSWIRNMNCCFAY